MAAIKKFTLRFNVWKSFKQTVVSRSHQSPDWTTPPLAVD